MLPQGGLAVIVVVYALW